MKKVIFIPGLGESEMDYKFRENINLIFPLSAITRDYYLKNFNEQIEPIVNCISKLDKQEFAILSARSFGAYLLLQSLIELNQPYQGTMALFSPVFGFPLIYNNKQGHPQFIGSKFRYAERLKISLDEALFPIPSETHIHYGKYDKQCDQSKCNQICQLGKTKPIILNGTGHDLGPQYIEQEIGKLA